MTAPALPFSPDLEIVAPDEVATQAELVETFRGIIETTNRDYGHAYRSVHAKSHALLEGELEVLPGLPAELAQGLCAKPATYPVILRISTNPGDPLPDSISVPRGLALKVIGVEGARLPGSEGDSTQDFVLAVGPAFSAGTPKAFLANLKMLAATTDKAEGGKKIISAVLRGAEHALEAIGLESAKLQTMGGYAHTHPLGERYFSQAALRWGAHYGKVAVVPLSANLKALEGATISIDGRDDALREEIGRELADAGAEWELRVQLARDADADPVEDASKPWPEDDNPYVAVARIRVAAQPTWSFDRARIVDDSLAFSPWHGLAAHQPLGAIMRARKPAYEASAELRSSLNGCPIHEPKAAEPLPA